MALHYLSSASSNEAFAQVDPLRWQKQLLAEMERPRVITDSALDRIADKVADAIIAKLESPLRVTQNDIRKFAPELLKGGKRER